MSHTKADRIAERPTHLCAAYGCKLLGTMSASTAGGEWWCFAHFGKDIGRAQGITAEIRRLDWLSNAINDVRNRDNHADYAAAFERISHDLVLAQRSDLRWTEGEDEAQWLARLETELAQLLAASFKPPPRQQPLAMPA